MLFIVTFINVLKYWTMLDDFNVFSDTNIIIFLCIKLWPQSSILSLPSIVVVDIYKDEIQEEPDEYLIFFIQIMIDINWIMNTKTKMNWNLKSVISKFKDEHCDNTKSKKNIKKGRVNGKRYYNDKYCSTKFTLIKNIIYKLDMLFS